MRLSTCSVTASSIHVAAVAPARERKSGDSRRRRREEREEEEEEQGDLRCHHLAL